MSTPATPNPASAPPPADPLRTLAFSVIYQPPQQDEAPSASVAETARTLSLDALRPEQRERVHHMAQRRLAMQLLYQLDVAGERAPAQALPALLASVDGLGPLAAQRVSDLVLGAVGSAAQADALFAKLAPEWPTHRLAPVDRAILRLGYFELGEARLPAAVVINEGVELARAFATDRSPPFVNALLDKAARALGRTSAAAQSPPSDTK